MKRVKTLRIILGDQLLSSAKIIQEADKKNDLFIFMEVMNEITYVKHHKIKVILILSAMRHFADKLKKEGYHIHYVKHDDNDNTQDFSSEIKRAVNHFSPETVAFTFPGEHRVWTQLKALEKTIKATVLIYPDEKFYTQPHDFVSWANGRKQLTMEYFYREQRKRFNILIEEDKPLGAQWNYDKDNRKKPPKNYKPNPPFTVAVDNTTKSVIDSLKTKIADHPGQWEDFHLAVTAEEAKKALAYFLHYNLPTFGDYQDAMLSDEPWMSHSHISFYLNIGLLTPHECVQGAIDALNSQHAKINAVEGFIRQVLGWREYIRGLYWAEMPGYAELNNLEASRDLPAFFWNANTQMNCLQHSIGQTLQFAYAHHIQRLMVIGNFCLLVGIEPKQVSDWYLAIYADAFEWVELPNVIGMILFADGGLLATKPYAAGGNYINKMSNYCSGCQYDVKEKTGDKACPFNYLYWNFIDRHEKKFFNNHRMALILKRWTSMDEEVKQLIRQSAALFLEQLK